MKRGWQPEFTAFVPTMTKEMFVGTLMEDAYRELAVEPQAWGEDVKAMKTPVLIITGDADVATLEHSVAMFRLVGGGIMGDMGKPLPESHVAVLPATSHTAVITQPEPLHALIKPFLKGETSI